MYFPQFFFYLSKSITSNLLNPGFSVGQIAMALSARTVHLFRLVCPHRGVTYPRYRIRAYNRRRRGGPSARRLSLFLSPSTASVRTQHVPSSCIFISLSFSSRVYLSFPPSVLLHPRSRRLELLPRERVLLSSYVCVQYKSSPTVERLESLS